MFTDYRVKAIYSSVRKIDVNEIVKERIKKIVEIRTLDESNCKNLNIECILAYIFKYGKHFGLNYKYECHNFIPNFNELVPLDLLDLRKKILTFNIENLKKYRFFKQTDSIEELYIKQINGDIKIPEYAYIYSGSARLPIYHFANKIYNYIDMYSENVILKPHMILPAEMNKIVDASFVSDIIIGSFTEDELKTYLNDMLLKYIEEYIVLVENNFPTLKHKMRFYNLFKNGVKLILYFYKKEEAFMGSYSHRLWYCYNEENKKEVEIIFCNEIDVPKELNMRWLMNGGIRELFFNEPINKPQYKYQVLSNMLYKLLEDDLKDLTDNIEFLLLDN